MKSPFYFIVKPLKGRRYDNTKEIAGLELVVSTSEEDHMFSNRYAEVIELPIGYTGEVKVGDTLLVHHNVFRTYLDVKGNKRKSNEYFRDQYYLVDPSKIYLYADEESWKTTDDYCFVSPVDYIQNSEIYRSDKEKEEHVGIIKYGSIPNVKKNQTVGFTKNSEYEFEIDGEKLYRMKNSDICIKFN